MSPLSIISLFIVLGFASAIAPAFVPGYAQTIVISNEIAMSYTVDQSTVNIAVSATIPVTNYLAVGFSPTLNMQGDAIVGSSGSVTAYAMSGDSTPTVVKAATYLSSPSCSYANGVLTMKFTRTLAAPSAGDVALSLSSASLGMVFAIGPMFKQHTFRIGMAVPYTASVTPFVPSVVPSSVAGGSTAVVPTSVASVAATSVVPVTAHSSIVSTTSGSVNSGVPAFVSGYAQTLLVSNMIAMSYTVDQSTVNIAVSATIPVTNYLAVGFSPTLNMQGDAIVGSSGSVTAYAMSGDSTPTVVKAATYLSSPSCSYANGVLTMKFTRTLAAPSAGDVALSLSSASLGMVFAIGPIFKQHTFRIGMAVPYTASVTPFVPSVVPSSVAGGSTASTASTAAMPTAASAGPTTPQLLQSNGTSGFEFSVGPISLSYTVDDTQIHMTASAPIASTDYLAIGFAQTPDVMVGADTVIAMNQAVSAYSIQGYTATDITNNPKGSDYLINPTYSYDSASGIATMTFSRLLNTQGSGDIALSLTAGAVDMIFATGPTFQDHLQNEWSASLPLSLSYRPPSPIIAEVEQYITLLILVALCVISFILHQFKVSAYLHQIYLVGKLSVGEVLFWIVALGSFVAYIVLQLKTGTVVNITGTIAFMALSLTLCPISRTSAWVRIFSVPLERAIPFHIIMGLTNVLAVILHFVIVILKFGLPVISKTSYGTVGVNPLAGLIALLSMIVMASLSLIRRSHWEIFLYTHKVCALITVVSALLHATRDYVFIIIPLVFYAVDLAFRFWDGSKRAEVVGLSVDGEITTLKIKPHSNSFKNFEAGSYAFVCVPAIGTQWHPFSIASSPDDTTLTFHIKNMGSNTWTGALHAYVAKVLDSQQDIEGGQSLVDESKDTTFEQFPVYVYGPYGSLSLKIEDSKNILMFAGGIGITPFLSIFRDLLAKKKTNKLEKVERVVLIWTTRRNDTVTKELENLLNECGDYSEFSIVIYDKTRPDIPVLMESLVNYKKDLTKKEILLHEGEFIASPNTSVLVCGPISLVNAVEKSAQKHKCFFHKESFLL